jgi:hypothetical protein
MRRTVSAAGISVCGGGRLHLSSPCSDKRRNLLVTSGRRVLCRRRLGRNNHNVRADAGRPHHSWAATPILHPMSGPHTIYVQADPFVSGSCLLLWRLDTRAQQFSPPCRPPGAWPRARRAPRTGDGGRWTRAGVHRPRRPAGSQRSQGGSDADPILELGSTHLDSRWGRRR